LQRADDSNQCVVLGIRIWRFILSFKLDPDREIVAFLTIAVTGCPGMPGTATERHELYQTATASNKQM
jgi:hypothetical protein